MVSVVNVVNQKATKLNYFNNWILFLLRHKIRLVLWLFCVLLMLFVIVKDDSDIFGKLFMFFISVCMPYYLIFRDNVSKPIE
jgi:hypothetical protein